VPRPLRTPSPCFGRNARFSAESDGRPPCDGARIAADPCAGSRGRRLGRITGGDGRAEGSTRPCDLPACTAAWGYRRSFGCGSCGLLVGEGVGRNATLRWRPYAAGSCCVPGRHPHHHHRPVPCRRCRLRAGRHGCILIGGQPPLAVFLGHHVHRSALAQFGHRLTLRGEVPLVNLDRGHVCPDEEHVHDLV
jgi:hypothetical protein